MLTEAGVWQEWSVQILTAVGSKSWATMAIEHTKIGWVGVPWQGQLDTVGILHLCGAQVKDKSIVLAWITCWFALYEGVIS